MRWKEDLDSNYFIRDAMSGAVYFLARKAAIEIFQPEENHRTLFR